MAQTVKHLSTMRETQVRSLGWEDPLEKAMAIHSSTIAWKIPCAERSLVGYSPWGRKESDTTERLHSLTHTVKGFGVVNKAEVDVFLELSCFFNDLTDVGNLFSGSSAFSKTNLNIWKFIVHVMLKLGLENFEHYYTIM